MAASSAARRPATSDEPPIMLERFLRRLNVLATVTSNALAQIYAERFGLTIPAWRAIAALGPCGTRTGRDIAAQAVLHTSTVSRAVSGLEARGLVARQPNGDDRREELLALTGEGRCIYAALAPAARAFKRKLAGALSPADQAMFFALIARLDAHARALAAHLGAGTPLSAETPA